MAEESSEEFHWGLTALSGINIPKEEAAQLENRLNSDPFDRSARATLIGFYSSGRSLSKDSERKRIKHVLWVIEHAPECELGKTPYLHISKILYPGAYQKARKLLLQHCERFKDNASVLTDLGCVFMLEEPELAAQILRQAHTIAENKDDVAFWLSMTLHRLGSQGYGQAALVESVSFMQEAIVNHEPSSKFDNRFWLAKMAFDSGQIELATQASNEMLADTKGNSQSAHVAHTMLGIIAVQNGDIPLAVEHLIEAGRVKRSPRLVSYGPMMRLAQDLLKAGQREAVLQYLQDCKKFWEMGQESLNKWIHDIEKGGMPTLEGDDW